MDILWDKSAWDDYQFWINNDRKVLQKINSLIKECQRTPFDGIGKPEPLKATLTGWWSRRINDADRMVYRGDRTTIEIASLRYHY